MLADIDSPLASKRSVLLYVRGSFHFPLIEPLIRENADIEFYLHSNLFGSGEVERWGFLKYANFHFVADLSELKFKLDRFGAFVTTDAEPANPHAYSLRLIEFFNAIRVPVFELQHGLFQLGLHYFDVPKGCGFGGDSLPAFSFAGHILTYYPPSGDKARCSTIGYPPFDGTLREDPRKDWTLVLSNLHWPTYAPEERRAFYEGVYRLAAGPGSEPVVWKLHHSEIGSTSCQALHRELAAQYPDALKRLRLHHQDAEIERLRLGELIARARHVVATVSTVLLDCEMHGKSVALFTCPSVACLTARISGGTFFSTPDELLDILEKGAASLKTGCLMPYDNAGFRRVLDGLYRRTALSRDKYLENVFSLLQPLNSELKWSLAMLKKAVETSSREMTAAVAAEVTASAESGMQAVRTESQKVGERVAELEADLLAAVRKGDEYMRHMDGFQERYDSIQRQLRAAEADVAALRERNEQAESRLKEETLRCRTLQSRLTAVAAERDGLCVEKSEQVQCIQELKSKLAAAERSLASAGRRNDEQQRRFAALEGKITRLTAIVVAESERRRKPSLIKRIVKGLAPYGLVCAWKRMGYGDSSERPLFAYPGALKRMKRIVKFSLPYAAVKKYRILKYGK